MFWFHCKSGYFVESAAKVIYFFAITKMKKRIAAIISANHPLFSVKEIEVY